MRGGQKCLSLSTSRTVKHRNFAELSMSTEVINLIDRIAEEEHHHYHVLDVTLQDLRYVYPVDNDTTNNPDDSHSDNDDDESLPDLIDRPDIYDDVDAHTESVPDLIDRSESHSVNDDDDDEALSGLIDRPDEVDDDYEFIQSFPLSTVQDITPAAPITGSQVDIFVDESINEEHDDEDHDPVIVALPEP